MLKKTITFKDLDGNELTEDFYFNLTKAELAELELGQSGGGMMAHLKRIVEAEDGGQIIGTFKRIILMSVGKRSEDNRRFIKNQEIVDDFAQTDAYTKLFMELCTDAEKGAEFIRGIVPQDLVEDVAAGRPVTDLTASLDQNVEEPAWIREGRVPTEKELEGASPEQLREAFRRKTSAQ